MEACKMKYMGCRGFAEPGEHFCPVCLELLEKERQDHQRQMEKAGITDDDLKYEPLDLSEFGINESEDSESPDIVFFGNWDFD